MDSPSLNQYEQQLYSVFKSFDVDDEESLPRAAVLQLCHALQLEERGAALVDALFERRAASARVSFAQFRSGLLAALGAEPPAPHPAPSEPPTPHPAPSEPPHSDDDSSGREVAPKFVYGSKKYGRRSRPPNPAEPAAAEEPERARRRMRCKRSASAMDDEPAPPDLDHDLDHDSRIDCERALALCHHLHMDNIDRRLVERIFEDVPAAETTVGEFFDRLNASLTSSISVSCEAGAPAAECDADVADGAGCGTLPHEAVVEAWDLAGVQKPRRLLAELGFGGVAVRAPDLERVLDRELDALPDPPDARGLLLLAALALSRLRQRRAQECATATAAERDRLRADVAEVNRRARILAQEVDENHARLEAELAASLRRAEARHAEAARASDTERAAERDRAATERAQLEADVARRAEAETRLRAEVSALRERMEEAETRAAAADERARAAEAECRGLVSELRSAAAPAGAEAGGGGGEDSCEAGAREEELRGENARLRDRCDELCEALEAAARRPPASPSAALPAERAASWREEAGAAGCATTPQDRSEASSLVSVEGRTAAGGAGGGGDASRADHEVDRLLEVVRELETSLEQMRVEYDRCEEYWSGKLEEERRAQDAELAASDARLAALAARVADYERQFARLPAIEERASLEAQFAHLEEEAASLRQRLDDATHQLAARDHQIAALKEQLAAPAPPPAPAQRRRRAHPPPAPPPVDGGCGVCGVCGCGGAGALWARATRAEGAVARLAARLAHADMLVKDLYVENCRLPLSLPPARRL